MGQGTERERDACADEHAVDDADDGGCGEPHLPPPAGQLHEPKTVDLVVAVPVRAFGQVREEAGAARAQPGIEAADPLDRGQVTHVLDADLDQAYVGEQAERRQHRNDRSGEVAEDVRPITKPSATSDAESADR
jgi:hypothetical protein